MRLETARRAVVLVALMLLACAWIVSGEGCAGPPQARTTFLRSVDLVEMTDYMAQEFAADEVIGQRTPASETWVISLERVKNETNQIIPDREKWLYLARLRGLLAASEIAAERNLIWVMPPERWAQIQDELGVSEEPLELRMKPTHLLTAEFHALTNTFAQGRSDTYVCDFQLIDLMSTVIVWEDQWEVKRSMRGLTYD